MSSDNIYIRYQKNKLHFVRVERVATSFVNLTKCYVYQCVYLIVNK